MVTAEYLKWQEWEKIKEHIIKLDNESMKLQYSAVETMAPIKHHLATIKISEVTDNKCLLD